MLFGTSSSGFDVSEAMETAQQHDDGQRKLSIGHLGLAAQQLIQGIADSSMSPEEIDELTARFRSLEQARQQGNLNPQRALGTNSGSSTPLRRSGDEDHDQRERADRAEADNEQLKRDKARLLAAVRSTGVTLPADGSVPDDVETRVTTAFNRKITEAQRAATPDDTVDKTKVRDQVGVLRSSWDQRTDAHRLTGGSARLAKESADKLDGALGELEKLVN